MGMYCNEKEGDVEVEGLVGCTAVLHGGRDTMEVWSEDYATFYGPMPAAATPALIHMAVEFYKNGMKAGRELGARDARHKIRQAILD